MVVLPDSGQHYTASAGRSLVASKRQGPSLGHRPALHTGESVDRLTLVHDPPQGALAGGPLRLEGISHGPEAALDRGDPSTARAPPPLQGASGDGAVRVPQRPGLTVWPVGRMIARLVVTTVLTVTVTPPRRMTRLRRVVRIRLTRSR